MSKRSLMATISHLPMQQWRECSIRTSTDFQTAFFFGDGADPFEPYWTL